MLSLFMVLYSFQKIEAKTEIEQNNVVLETQNIDLEFVKPASVSGVLIFLGGILVGYLIDGVIVYTTGHSAAEWTAQGIGAIMNWGTIPGVKSVYFSDRGNLFNYALNEHGCWWVGPRVGGRWDCLAKIPSY